MNKKKSPLFAFLLAWILILNCISFVSAEQGDIGGGFGIEIVVGNPGEDSGNEADSNDDGSDNSNDDNEDNDDNDDSGDNGDLDDSENFSYENSEETRIIENKKIYLGNSELISNEDERDNKNLIKILALGNLGIYIILFLFIFIFKQKIKYKIDKNL
jgi:hypothetical protein